MGQDMTQVLPCHCDRQETAFDANPHGHNVSCPCWGTNVPHRLNAPAPVFTEAEVLAAMEAVQKAARVAVLNSGTEGPAGAINLIDLPAILSRIRGGR